MRATIAPLARGWAITGVLLLVLAGSARAATITVTTTADDNTPNDGSVSLREAIQAIDAGNTLGDPDISSQNPGVFGVNDTIRFNISTASTRQTILVGQTGNGALPALSRPMTIDGYSEPGASRNTLANGDNAGVLIALDGANAGPSADGILVDPSAAGSTIEGLDVFDFPLNQIELQGAGVVAGNQVGFDNTGAPAHSTQGVVISGASSSLIGGVTAGARNVISGNVGSGVDIAGTTGSPATGNFVEGNFIGTDATGVAADGNGRAGAFAQGGAVQISGGNGNTIGGGLAQSRNVISGNGGGVDIRNGGQFNLVQGNFIGVGADGVTPVPNNDFGVRVASDDNLAPPLGPGQANEPASAGNIIGLSPYTSFTGLGNVIADNGGDGVQIDESYLPNNATPLSNSGNSINGNSIYGNGGLGIDLKGGTGNILPNNLMSAPTITAANPAGISTVVQGTLHRPASPGMGVHVELFSSPRCGSGMGQALLGSADTTTDGSGNGNFSVRVSSQLAPGQILNATATNTTADPSSQPGSLNLYNTSEFSSCFTVPIPVVTLPPEGAAPARPVVSNVKQSHRRWREGQALAGISRRAPARNSRRKRPSSSRKLRLPVGTTFSFTLSEQAQVSFAFTQSLPGRRVGGRCVAQTRRNRRRRACTRIVSAGTLTFTGHYGLDQVAFQGRLPSQKLKPGNYTLTVTATNTVGQHSQPQTLRFTIAR